MEKKQYTLDDLHSLAQAIDEKSERINKKLSEFERQLCAVHLGSDVWLDEVPLKVTTPQTGEPRTDTVLGFARIPGEIVSLGKVGLAVREVKYYASEPEAQKRVAAKTLPIPRIAGNYAWREDGEVRPLLSASRELRTVALRQKQLLIDAVGKAAEDLIAKFDQEYAGLQD